MHGWLNICKPLGVSSAKVVAIIKKALHGNKVGHCGTLDVEAEGVLPLAVGEATKLVRILVDAKKTYVFTIKFGAKTDTADASGQVIATTITLPSKVQCVDVCTRFIGSIIQVPPKFSALKIGGVRAYTLARQNSQFEILPRTIQIYALKCLAVNEQENSASYLVQCSKGTYIRTLAEDIALSLQSLGFVIELRRTQVGQFFIDNALRVEEFIELSPLVLQDFLETKMLKTEAVLDDIPVLEATLEQVKQIKFGIRCIFEYDHDLELWWVRHQNMLVAIGSLNTNCFKSSRVFNLN